VTDQDVEPVTMRRVSLRLLPFLFLLYIFCWLDRSNISIAALQMNSELKFSSAVFGFGAGIFFLSYSLFELPSNLILARLGARRWLARIAITWGLLACSMMWVRTPQQFYAVRFLLGMAEAGFPTRLLQGSSAAAGIALVSSIGTSGGFFGPSIIGFLKQTTGSDSGAFLGLAGLALLGALVCLGLRQTAAFGYLRPLPAKAAVTPRPMNTPPVT
jgi:MFS family permease